MVARIQTNKLFQGKIYAKTKPNSCMNDIVESLDFDLRMPYNDLLCDVKQKEHGKFSNDIVIQHHDMIVSNFNWSKFYPFFHRFLKEKKQIFINNNRLP